MPKQKGGLGFRRLCETPKPWIKLLKAKYLKIAHFNVTTQLNIFPQFNKSILKVRSSKLHLQSCGKWRFYQNMKRSLI